MATFRRLVQWLRRGCGGGVGNGSRIPVSRESARRFAAACIACAAALLAAPFAHAALPIDRIKLPPGFHIEVLSADLPGAREMTLSGNGTLYVGSMGGDVYALELKDGRAIKRHIVASGLTMPVGVAWHNGALYVSAVSSLVRLDDIDGEQRDAEQWLGAVAGWLMWQSYNHFGTPNQIRHPDRARMTSVWVVAPPRM